jgi:hypothetical protein
MRMNFTIKALFTLVGMGLGPIVLAATVAGSASPLAENPATAAALDFSTGHDAGSADGAHKSSATKTDETASMARTAPDAPAPLGNANAAIGKPAHDESISAAYKDLVKATGAQDTYQNLSADPSLEKARQVLDAGSEEEIDAARRARVNNEASANMRTGGPERTEEQIRQDEARASLLAAQLLDEVAPWVGGAVVLYVGMKIARYFLLRSRAKASRRRKSRRSMVRSR